LKILEGRLVRTSITLTKNAISSAIVVAHEVAHYLGLDDHCQGEKDLLDQTKKERCDGCLMHCTYIGVASSLKQVPGDRKNYLCPYCKAKLGLISMDEVYKIYGISKEEKINIEYRSGKELSIREVKKFNKIHPETEKYYKMEPGACFFAFVDGEPAGLLLGSTKDKAHFHFFVSKEYRGQHIATSLENKFEQYCRNKGISIIETKSGEFIRGTNTPMTKIFGKWGYTSYHRSGEGYIHRKILKEELSSEKTKIMCKDCGADITGTRWVAAGFCEKCLKKSRQEIIEKLKCPFCGSEEIE